MPRIRHHARGGRLNRPDEALYAKELPDGRIVYVMPILFGRAYLTVASAESDRCGTYDEVYTYETRPLALYEAALWNGDGEPGEWIRHQPSNRRRPGGDPSREHVWA